MSVRNCFKGSILEKEFDRLYKESMTEEEQKALASSIIQEHHAKLKDKLSSLKKKLGVVEEAPVEEVEKIPTPSVQTEEVVQKLAPERVTEEDYEMAVNFNTVFTTFFNPQIEAKDPQKAAELKESKAEADRIIKQWIQQQADKTPVETNLTENNDNTSLTEEQPKPSKRKRRDDYIELQSSRQLPTIQSTPVTQTDIEKVKKMFGEHEPNIKQLLDIVNSEAWATWSKSAITLYRGATRADLYHEAWHHFSQLYLTKDQKTRLYNETRNSVKELDNKSDLEVEEYIARDFSKFIETGKIKGNFPERKTLFQWIKDFFLKLFGKDMSLGTLYKELSDGTTRRTPSTDNIYFSKLNSGITKDFKLTDTPKIMGMLDALIVEALSEGKNKDGVKLGGNVLDIDRIKDINKLYNAIYNNKVTELEDYEDKLSRTSPGTEANRYYANLVSNLNKLLEDDNWDAVVKYHKENSKKIRGYKEASYQDEEDAGILPLEESIENNTDESEITKESFNDKSSSEISFYDSADKDVIRMIETITSNKIDPDWGYGKAIDAPMIIGLLMNKLSGINQFYSDGTHKSNMLDQMAILAEKYPVIQTIINRLTSDITPDSTSASGSILRSKFLQTFSRPTAPIKIMTSEPVYAEKSRDEMSTDEIAIMHMVPGSKPPIVDTGKVMLLDSSVTNSAQMRVKEMLKANFLVTPDTEFIITKDGRKIIPQAKLELIKNFDISTVERKKLFLKKLGLLPSFPVNDSILFKVQFVKQQLVKVLAKRDVDQIVDMLDEKGEDSNTSFLTSLIAGYQKFDDDFTSNSFKNAEGKTEYELMLWNRMNILLEALNNTDKYPTLQSIIKEPEYAYLEGFFEDSKRLDLKGSQMLAMMFNKDGTRKENAKKIQLINYNGLQKKLDSGDYEGLKTKKLYAGDKAIMDITYLVEHKIYPTVQLGDKSSFFAMSLGQHFAKNNIAFRSIMKGYLADEMDIIKEYKNGNKNLTNLKKLSDNIINKEGVYQFGIFKDIFGKELTNTLISQIGGTNTDVKAIIANTEYAIDDAIDTYLSETSKEVVDYLQSKNLGAFMKKNPMDIRMFTMNQLIFNIESSKLVFGNTYFHKDPHKRFSGASSAGTLVSTDPGILEEFKYHSKITQRGLFAADFEKHYGMKMPVLSTREASDHTLRFISFKDSEVGSVYYDSYLNEVRKEIMSANLSEEATDMLLTIVDSKALTEEERSDAISSFFKENKGADKRRIFRILDARNDIVGKYSSGKVNEADAQGAVTVDFFRKVQWLTGRWNWKMERAYQKIIQWDSMNRSAKRAEQGSEEQKTFLQKREAFNLTSEEMMYFQPQKLQYFGNVKNDSIQEVGFHKFSLVPLIPQIIDGKSWEKHLEKMLVEDVDYAVFDSGNKLERSKDSNSFYTTGRKVSTVEEGMDAYKAGKPTYTIQTGFLNNLKEQVKITPHIHDDIIFGTQFRKLLFPNLDSDDLDNVPNNKKELVELYNEYKNTLNKMTQGELDRIFQDTSISGSPYEGYTIKNIPKFIKFLERQIENRVVNKNIKKYFQVNQDGKFLHNLDTSIQRQNIESIISSVLNKKLVRQRMNGDMMIQVSSVGFEDYNSGAPTLEQGSNGLRFYYNRGDRVVSAQVKVALTGSFKNLLNALHDDGQKIGSRERLNEMLKSDTWMEKNAKSVTMIGYRIPTQEHNSMEVFEVQEFMDEIAGSTIVVPSEITSKSGSDFDIDKMNIFKPNLDENGQYIESLSEEELSSLYDKFVKDNLDKQHKIEDLLFMLSPEDFTEALNNPDLQKQDLTSKKSFIKAMSKAGLQNKIIEISSKVLLRKNNLRNLVTPNSTYLYDDLIKKMIEAYHPELIKDGKVAVDVKLTKSFSPVENWKKFESLYDLKSALGIAANANTFSKLLQLAGAKINAEYMKKHPIYFNVFDKMGNINLSDQYLGDGVSKASAIGQSINLYVDAANNPAPGFVNMGMATAPVTFLLLNMSVPISHIFSLMNQPIIRDYIDLKNARTNSKLINIDYTYPELYEKYDRDVKIGTLNSTLSKQLNIKLKQPGSFGDEFRKMASYEEMERAIQEKDTARSDEFNTQQLFYLQQFMEFEKIASDFRNVQSNLGLDTKLLQTSFDSYKRTADYNLNQKVNMIRNMSKIKHDSIISSYDTSKLVLDINKLVLPLMNIEKVNKDILELLKDGTVAGGKTAKVAASFERAYKNDLVMFVFQNFLSKSKAGTDFFESLYGTRDTEAYSKGLLENLYKELQQLKTDHPELVKSYSLLSNFYPNKSSKVKNQSSEKITNIALVYPSKDVSLQNNYIDQFEELYSNPVTYNFMKKFALLSFYQSGLNKSNISSTDIIKIDDVATMLDFAVQEFNKLSAQEKQAYLDIYKKSDKSFFKNNNKFNGSSPQSNVTHVESTRAKDYVVSADAVQKRLADVVREEAERQKQLANMKKDVYTVVESDEVLAQIRQAESENRPISMKEITDHTGGALGADSMFDAIGREFGVVNHVHYYHGKKTPMGNRALTDAEVQEGIIHAKAAAKALVRPWDDKFGSLLGRNWFQVKNSTQVVAIAPIVQPGEVGMKGFTSKASRATVDGGTGYAVEMAIANGKEVNVFNTKDNKWYKWNGTDFVRSEVPILHKDFAGIGSRQDNGKMTPESIQAIRDVYQKTLDNVVFKPTVEETIIYNKLGNKTVSEHVVIKPWSELKDAKKAITPQGIVATRIYGTDNHFGNPFSHDDAVIAKNPTLIKVASTRAAVEAYMNWILTGETGDYLASKADPSELDERRDWIREQLESGDLKGQPILYYKELGEPSHATALDYLINKYNWTKEEAVVQETNKERKTYEGNITSLKPNQVFVFGSNTEGRHGKGSALTAKEKFGAKYGQAKGLQGQSYAIITKDLTKNVHPSVDRKLIVEQIEDLYELAYNTDKEYFIAYKGESTNLNGYTPQQMADMFKEAGYFGIPSNIIFEKKFAQLVEGEPAISKVQEVDTYKYYGKFYDIITEDGKGIDVKDYKGKNIDKQRMLSYYNLNPDIDPQNGKSFRGTSDITTSSPSKISVAREFVFEDGKKVETPFKLNEEQEGALTTLADFINNPKAYDNQVTLLGYAGTGKTSIIGIFNSYLKQKYIEPFYSSPTHRANAVTKMKNPKAKVLTLHSLFGLSGEIKLDEGDYDLRDLEFAQTNKPKIQRGDTLIVDEASMVNIALYQFLEKAKTQLNLNIIYVGDPAQLKPVKEDNISMVFSKGTQVQLTKVERTGDNPILEESTNLRNNKDFNYQTKIVNNEGVEYLENPAKTRQIVAEAFTSDEFKENKLFFRILSAKNAQVAQSNKIVRQLIYPDNHEDQLIVGDVLMGYDNFDIDYNTKEPLIINSGDYQVTRLTSGEKTINLGRNGSETYKGYHVTVENLLSPTDKPKSLFVVDNNEDESKLLLFAESIAVLNREGAKFMKAGNMQLAAQNFGAARALQAQLAVMKNIIDNAGKLKVKKTLDYGYAHTIHKSQGGTYNKVLILADTISAPFDVQAQQQLKYVAMSRASEFVYVQTNHELAEPIVTNNEDEDTSKTPEC